MPTYHPYAKTQAARRWLERYRLHEVFEDKEPTTVCLYDCRSCYGGPEEGGWYYESGYPLRTVCIFSKKQAVKAAIELEAFAKEEFGSDKDNLGWATYRICFDTDYAKPYPQTKPHYE